MLRSLLIRELFCLTDEATVERIRENPYLQYFIEMTEYHYEARYYERVAIALILPLPLIGGGCAVGHFIRLAANTIEKLYIMNFTIRLRDFVCMRQSFSGNPLPINFISSYMDRNGLKLRMRISDFSMNQIFRH